MAKIPSTKDEEIKELKSKVRVLKNKIREMRQSYLIDLWQDIEGLAGTYHNLVFPVPIRVSSNHAGNKESFDLNLNDIIGFVSNDRPKTIYMNRMVSTAQGYPRTTWLVTVDFNKLGVKELSRQLNSAQTHLLKVSQGSCINIIYYGLKKIDGIPHLVFRFPRNPKYPLPDELLKIKINSKVLNEWNQKVNDFKRIQRLQKIFSSYISEK